MAMIFAIYAALSAAICLPREATRAGVRDNASCEFEQLLGPAPAAHVSTNSLVQRRTIKTMRFDGAQAKKKVSLLCTMAGDYPTNADAKAFFITSCTKDYGRPHQLCANLATALFGRSKFINGADPFKPGQRFCDELDSLLDLSDQDAEAVEADEQRSLLEKYSSMDGALDGSLAGKGGVQPEQVLYACTRFSKSPLMAVGTLECKSGTVSIHDAEACKAAAEACGYKWQKVIHRK
jgi:hypothetical protein